jgi:hypothetical protein
MPSPFTVKKEQLIKSQWIADTDDRLGKVRDVSPRRTQSKQRTGERIFGPIPISWACVAIDVSLSAFGLGVLLWHQTKLRKGPVPLTDAVCKKYHVDRKTARRLLHKLEDAGLVIVERNHLQAPRVSIVSLEGKPRNG